MSALTRTIVAFTPLLLATLFAACSPDAPPPIDIPSWAKVAPEQIAEAKKHGVPVAFENDLGMRFVLIPAGTFLMGSPEDEEGRDDDETQHEVTISKPFYMQITEVTNGQYSDLQADHDSSGEADPAANVASLPVANLTRSDAEGFAQWLSEFTDTRTYRLPTEAEWEHACRAGTGTRFWWGGEVVDGARYANLRAARVRAEEATEPTDAEPPVPLPVASLEASPWGLHDMHGNVAEWVADWYAPYPASPVADPQGPAEGRKRMLRGAHWKMPWHMCGAGHRDAPPSTRHRGKHDGFRLVSPLSEQEP